MTRSFFSPRASHLHSIIHLILRHWPKIAPNSSSLHCILVLLWCGMVSRARLKGNSWCASGRVWLLSDPWWFFCHPWACREQAWWWGDRCAQPGGPAGSWPSVSSPHHWDFHTLGILLWQFFFNYDLHATYCQKEWEMIYNKTCLKQDS